ncbi:hypothetical protein C6P46_004558 [Rhodotorula mucilaginosa]|uniref:Sfi1 spindle body domain-containing protein n=1 Tax=Rhodotorula mucilaginosa TaxID=5537 RepID=A0A9P6W0K5_RHOMI|nr:hypothetical protein C6P46_004558 [Rhodotorula mucilaginosa]
MAPDPGYRRDASTSSSSSTRLEQRFPPLTDKQRLQIEQTLARLPANASTWADLTRAQQRDPRQDDEDDLYEVWLKLVWQDGVTWHDKWNSVKRQLTDPLPVPPHRHRRRPSDNLDVLREKLDRVTTLARGTAAAATDHEAPAAPRQQQPPPRRPHSTPPSRPLLVRPTRRRSPTSAAALEAGHSSSDEQFVGVPKPSSTTTMTTGGGSHRLVLPPGASRRAFLDDDDNYDRHPPAPTTTTTTTRRPPATTARRRRSSHPAAESRPAAAVRGGLSPGERPPPVMMSTPARPTIDRLTEPDPTPLLSARLSSLHLAPPAPLADDGRRRRRSSSESSSSSSGSLLIASAFSPPEAVSRADQFSRLRILLPSFSHWRVRTTAIRQRELDLEDKRRVWLLRCAIEQWRRVRLEAIRAAYRVAERFDQRRLVRWVRGESRRALGARERQRKINGLTRARDRLVARVDHRALHHSLDRWRLRTAARVVVRKRASHLARAALYAWQRRRRAVRAREEELKRRAEWQADRWELGRAERAWKGWRRLTALRGGERSVREGQERRLRGDAWEIWRTKTYEVDRVRRLEALASRSDAHRLATEALTRWVGQLVLRREQESIASRYYDENLVKQKRAKGLLTRWRLRLRLRLSMRVGANDLAASMVDKWLARLDHVQVELATRADARLAERDSTLLRVTFTAWRASRSRVSRLTLAAQGVHRTRLLVQAVEKWRGRVEHERVLQASRADVRLAAVTLNVWLENVIAHKEREREAVKWSNARVARFGFAGWAAATVRAEQRLVLADAHRAVKLEELRERVFRQWHDLAQRSRTLRERCAAVLQLRRRARLENAFDTWRERSLRRGEEVVAQRREGRERREAWDWWKARTKTLAAIEFHKVRLGSRAFACWRAWTPPRELSLQAIETDRRAMSSGALQRSPAPRQLSVFGFATTPCLVLADTAAESCFPVTVSCLSLYAVAVDVHIDGSDEPLSSVAAPFRVVYLRRQAPADYACFFPVLQGEATFFLVVKLGAVATEALRRV